MSVCIKGIPAHVARTDIQKACEAHGLVHEMQWCAAKSTAYVHFREVAVGQRALDTLQGTELGGKTVDVEVSWTGRRPWDNRKDRAEVRAWHARLWAEQEQASGEASAGAARARTGWQRADWGWGTQRAGNRGAKGATGWREWGWDWGEGRAQRSQGAKGATGWRESGWDWGEGRAQRSQGAKGATGWRESGWDWGAQRTGGSEDARARWTGWRESGWDWGGRAWGAEREGTGEGGRGAEGCSRPCEASLHLRAKIHGTQIADLMNALPALRIVDLGNHSGISTLGIRQCMRYC